jgi:hypothetical protein
MRTDSECPLEVGDAILTYPLVGVPSTGPPQGVSRDHGNRTRAQ